METSRYFERTLFYDRSPAADEYYQRSADLVFEKDPARSRIEVRVQSSSDVSYYARREETESKDEYCDEDSEHPLKKVSAGATVYVSHKETKLLNVDTSHESDSEDACSLSSKASSTALPTALDQHRGGSYPPKYPGLPKLVVVNLDVGNLQGFIKDTNSDFRVFYLRQRHSYSRLQITKEVFEQLLKSCHVFPRFNEYLIGFGMRNSESEVGPPPLKFRPLCETRSNNYHGFECSYILRYVEFTNRIRGKRPKRPWSLRQFAVYHRYKPKYQNRCSTWILVGASQRTEVRLDRYTRSIDDLTGSNPFELHVIFLDTAIASWRPYLVDLTQQVTLQSNKAVGIMIDSGDGEEDFISIEVEDHQELKQIEDQIADLILCLDSTSDTVSTFMEMYEQFRDHQNSAEPLHHSPHKSAYGSDAVVFALKEKTKEIAYTRKKAEALLSKVQNTRTLISSLLERQSGHNINQQISALQNLEQQGQVENATMRVLAEKNSRDSSSMRVLTIITMIYLPCTIVSNFYSTQFVNQKELDSGGIQLQYTQNSWLFFAISVPLTVLTILVWYLWVNFERIQQFILYRGGDYEKELSDRTRRFRLNRPLRGLPR